MNWLLLVSRLPQFQQKNYSRVIVKAATCVGFKTFPDDYYRNWPFPLTDEEVSKGFHLRPLNNQLVFGRLLIERAGCLTSMKRLDEATAVWQKALPYLTEIQDAPRYARRAEGKRDMEKWYSLWNEVTQLPIPEGSRYSYFQNWKVQIHTFMAHSGNIVVMEKLVAGLKEQVNSYRQQQIQPVILDRPEQITIWPLEPEQMPESLVPPELVRLKQMIPQLMRVPMEMIPHEYWRGMPQELQARLQLLNKEDDVVSEMYAYATEETQLRNLQAVDASRSFYNLPPLWKPQENAKLSQFAAQFGISVDHLPWTYRDKPVPEELQKRLVSRLQYVTTGSDIGFMDEVRQFEGDEYQRRSVLEAIAKRRMPLDQELKMRQQLEGRTTPPWQPPVATENTLFPQPQFPLTPQPQSPINLPATSPIKP